MNQRINSFRYNTGISYQRQGGAVLIVALSLLVILTILGVSVMESSVIEEKMAGNNLDRNVAFQSAESALRAAEDWLSAQPSRPEPVKEIAEDAVLVLDELRAEADSTMWWRDSTKDNSWWLSDTVTELNPSAVKKAELSAKLAYLPRYVIEEYGQVCDGAINDPSALTCKVIYRITARGWGGSESSTVMLQSLYAKRF